MVTIALPADQRNALYAHIKVHLLAVDDLRLAIETGDLETADRLGRRIAGELRLIEGGLGWGDERHDPVKLSLSADELRAGLTELRDRAIAQYESAQDEQEAFREPWEKAALVRDACDQALARLA
jgi:hypothetical protein